MSMMPTAMILDAGFASLPLQQAIKAAGFRTLACSGKAQDAGMKYADATWAQNYADSEAVLAIARQEKITALSPGVTDVSYLSGCRVAQALGLPGYDSPEVSDLLFLKDHFRKWASEKGYPIPKAASNVQEARTMPFPLLVKPVDAYSGKGISLIHQPDELNEAVNVARAASAGGHCVIETFCQGALYSHSAFIRGGEITCEFFVDEYCTVYPWQVNSSCLSVNLPESMRDQISECMQAIVSDLGLVDGLLHTQLIADERQFWLIEVTRRCPGDLYSKLIELSTGVDYCREFVAPFIGQTSHLAHRRPARRRNIARHTVSSTHRSLFFGFNCAPLPANILQAIPLKQPGDEIGPAPGDRAGLIFAEFTDLDAMASHTPQLKNYFSFSSL
ncbi:TPA: ATP-grasp domain-containing protein [Enterobacter ludwigii]|uniref:ATP-grasp domain-containing protein n=1 Tax=Enterobacter ludwigii TaxID=299767 RepID=UPI0018A965B4|nr:ATP-grasp domain-containing protein [Enterobacter ludwigii]HDR2456572.1 ATP-grasp domain-containing protein [Enterobacter ludwigii]HDR2550872.1 ATP-grasp domain-containing protein [Enterobacter ludwigii]HDR2554218.1 ATP-grasp domain-containing protein [Enterobacter ludwigii]HDR2569834.1 ATP-grasp domain-containing protein [Enterobacter ludwigii]